jgi:outer membrane receptor for ferrienterochelin and colicin
VISTTFNNIYEYIDGRLSGVRVINNNQIVVRGTNTMTGSTDPLFVVDGVIVYDISFVNPNEVKRLDLLNGAAASIYGSESANGVIQIITK